MMYRIYLSAIALALSSALHGQQSETRRPMWSLSAAVGPTSGYFILEKNLSQDRERGDKYTYQPSVALGLHYRPAKGRWNYALLWSMSGSRISSSSRQNKETMATYSGMLYRRYLERNNRYLYWGFGLGIKHSEEKRTSSAGFPESSSYTNATLHLVPFGACIETGRVGIFLETALIQLPLVAGGMRVNVGK